MVTRHVVHTGRDMPGRDSWERDGARDLLKTCKGRVSSSPIVRDHLWLTNLAKGSYGILHEQGSATVVISLRLTDHIEQDRQV